VYKTLKQSDIDEHSRAFQIERELPSSLDEYDLIVAPVHLPLNHKDFKGKLMTHHEAVKILIGDQVDFPVVEITGSFGKTTSIKYDSTINITGRRITPLLNLMKINKNPPLDTFLFKSGNVWCVEIGGPELDVGCTGRGIIVGSELSLKETGLQGLRLCHF
jgi:hypothetical protein